MKATLTRRLLLCAVLPALLLLAVPSRAQVTVTSTNGYSVYVAVTPTSIIPNTTTNCPSGTGYQYQVGYSYNISFSGTNIPSNLWTLQAYFTCGAQTGIYAYLPTTGGTGTGTSANTSTSATNCATATPSSNGCLSGYQLVIYGPGINSQTITVTPSNTGGTSLPITLKTFDARMEGNTVALAWTTSVETGHNVFTIERSNNGTDWSALTSVEGHGDANGGAYTYTDARPRPGMNYYRLKSNSDDDKAPEYSKVIGAKMFSAATDISIYPNPGHDNSLRISGLADAGNWKIELCNAAGQRFPNTSLKGTDLTLPDLAAGLYFLRLTNVTTGESATLKYTRQ